VARPNFNLLIYATRCNYVAVYQLKNRGEIDRVCGIDREPGEKSGPNERLQNGCTLRALAYNT